MNEINVKVKCREHEFIADPTFTFKILHLEFYILFNQPIYLKDQIMMRLLTL